MPLASTDEMEDSGDDGYITEVVRRILAAKDQGLVSDKAYHELRMALPEDMRCRIPPLSAIMQERKRQNMSINIIPIPQVKTAYSMTFCGLSFKSGYLFSGQKFISCLISKCYPPYIKYKYDLGEGGGGVLVIGYFFYKKKKMLRNIVCFYLFLIKIRQDKRLKLTRVNYTDKAVPL